MICTDPPSAQCLVGRAKSDHTAGAQGKNATGTIGSSIHCSVGEMGLEGLLSRGEHRLFVRDLPHLPDDQ